MSSTSLAAYGPDLGHLAQWVERQIADGATRLILRQKSEAGEQLVREFPTLGESPNPLADAVYRKAEDDGRHFRGRSVYGVFAFRDRDYVDRLFFTIDGDEDQAYFGQREANLSGVTTQLMRHNEANARLAIGQTLDVISHYKALLAAREKRIEELESKYWKVVELYERLTSMQHERELEVKRLEQADKRQEFLREKLDMLAPVLMSKIVPGANKGALGEELIRQLLKSLSPEQMQTIVGALSPEQAAVINEVYVAYGERELAKDEAKKKNGKKQSVTNGAASH
jgi:hypothetical protein